MKINLLLFNVQDYYWAAVQQSSKDVLNNDRYPKSFITMKKSEIRITRLNSMKRGNQTQKIHRRQIHISTEWPTTTSFNFKSPVFLSFSVTSYGDLITSDDTFRVVATCTWQRRRFSSLDTSPTTTFHTGS